MRDIIHNSYISVPLKEVLFDSYGGGTPSTKEDTFWDGDIPWTTTAIIEDNSFYLSKFQRNITQQGLANSSSKIVPKGSILFGSRVGVGKVAITSFDIAINQDITAFIPNEKIIPEFFLYALKSPGVKSQILDKKRGTTIKGIPRNDLLEITIPFPPLEEQQAIARTLQTVQEAQERTEAVIEATQNLKAAIMRHLFTFGPVPVEDRDKIRLKETDIGLIPSKWDVFKIGEIATVASGGTPSRENSEYWGGDIPWIKTGEIKYNTIFDTEEKITKLGLDSSSARIIPKGTLIMAMYGQGITRGKVAITGIDAAINQAIAAILVKPSINPHYLLYYLQYSYERIRQLGHGANQRNLNGAIIKSIEVIIPPIKEQNRIVKILNSLDNKSDIESKNYHNLECLFKSLLISFCR